jgi:hypothetical protein
MVKSISETSRFFQEDSFIGRCSSSLYKMAQKIKEVALWVLKTIFPFFFAKQEEPDPRRYSTVTTIPRDPSLDGSRISFASSTYWPSGSNPYRRESLESLL